MWKMFSNVPQVIAELLDQSFLTKPVDLARLGTFGLNNNKIKDDESCYASQELRGLSSKKCWNISFTYAQTIRYPLTTTNLNYDESCCVSQELRG
jgi:hypothetical protein